MYINYDLGGVRIGRKAGETRGNRYFMYIFGRLDTPGSLSIFFYRALPVYHTSSVRAVAVSEGFTI